MNVWDWIEIFELLWLVALSAWAVMMTLAFGNLDRTIDFTRGRVRQLEKENERLREFHSARAGDKG